MNRFRTCRANLHKSVHLLVIVASDKPRHIVNTCPLTKLEGGLNRHHEADDDAVIWLESTATAALTK